MAFVDYIGFVSLDEEPKVSVLSGHIKLALALMWTDTHTQAAQIRKYTYETISNRAGREKNDNKLNNRFGRMSECKQNPISEYYVLVVMNQIAASSLSMATWEWMSEFSVKLSIYPC